MTWTDIHSHILPGFDDGASSDEEFLEIARVAVEGGTSLMAATPHYDPERPAFEPGAAARAVERCNGLLQASGIPLTLVPGVEVRINAGLYDLAMASGGLAELKLGRKGKYMLVDLPLMDMPVSTGDILFQIQLRGITPILAHPERNRYLVEHPFSIRDMALLGIEMQVDSGSLEGMFGRSAKHTARLLLKEGIARLVATDAHEPRGRGPDLSCAARALKGLLGEEAPRILMDVNPGLVLDGQRLPAAAGRPARKTGAGIRRLPPRSRGNRPHPR